MIDWIERNRALTAYLLSGLIFAVVAYAVMFSARDDAIEACRITNEQIAEVNERAPILNTLVRLEQTEVEEGEHTEREVRPLHRARHVHLAPCAELFDPPWPFSAF